jgi:hypothetical protein
MSKNENKFEKEEDALEDKGESNSINYSNSGSENNDSDYVEKENRRDKKRK